MECLFIYALAWNNNGPAFFAFLSSFLNTWGFCCMSKIFVTWRWDRFGCWLYSSWVHLHIPVFKRSISFFFFQVSGYLKMRYPIHNSLVELCGLKLTQKSISFCEHWCIHCNVLIIHSSVSFLGSLKKNQSLRDL